MMKFIKNFIISSIVLGFSLTLAGCNKEEASASSQDNYLCVITSNQYLAPSSLAKEVYRGFVANQAACNVILEDYKAGRRTV